MEDWQIKRLKVEKIDANNSIVKGNGFDDTERPCPMQQKFFCPALCDGQDTCVWGYWKRAMR